MRKKILLLVFVSLTNTLNCPSENLLPENPQKYGRSSATIKDGGFRIDALPGKWCAVTSKVPLKKGYYRFTLEYKAGGETPAGTILKVVLSPEILKEKYRREYNANQFSGTWKTLSGYLCMPSDGDGRINAYVECRQPAGIMIRRLKLEPLTEKQLSTVRVESEKDLAMQWEPQWKFRDTASRLELVPSEDHIEGGYALKITPAKGIRTAVAGIAVPAPENSFCRVSVWLKSTPEIPVIITADGWAPGEKHWYKSLKIRTAKEWQCFSFEIKTPELSRYRGMLRIQITPCADYSSLQIKDAMLTRILHEAGRGLSNLSSSAGCRMPVDNPLSPLLPQLSDSQNLCSIHRPFHAGYRLEYRRKQ